MTEGWTCTRCGTVNDAARFGCRGCGLLRADASFGSGAGATAPVESGPPDMVAPGTTDPALAPPQPPPAEPSVGDPPPGSAPTASPWAAGGVSGWVPLSGGATAADASTGREEGASGWTPPPGTTPPGDGGVSGWSPPDGSAPAAGPVPLWRRIPIGFVIVMAFVLGGAALGWYFGAGRSSSGEINKAGDLQANDLRVGDCFDLKDREADEVGDVTARPCTTAHEFELFFTGSMADGAYPSDADFESFVEGACLPAFATYIGTAYEDSTLDLQWLQPTDDAWREGDRSVQCAVFHPDNAGLTTSVKDSGL